MSQAKVDRYKEQKKNRAKIMAKEKREWMLTKVGGGILALALVGWIGVSVYNSATTKTEENTPVETKEYTINASALDNYLETLPEY